MEKQSRKQMTNIWNKIKYFLILTGIFALIAIFYITKKKLEIKSLQKLIQKAYQQKQKILEDKIAVTVEKTTETKGNTDKLVKKLDKLHTQKTDIETKLQNLSDEELTDAVGSWFERRTK